MKNANNVVYNVYSCSATLLHLKDEYEQLIERIKKRMKEIEYNCRIDFNIAEYLLAPHLKYKLVNFPVIHIIAKPATDEIMQLIEDAIQQNIECNDADMFEDSNLELKLGDLLKLSVYAWREDAIELHVSDSNKILDITRHDSYAI